MINYPFFLDTSSKKHKCPNCDKKTFTYYVFSDTKEIIDEKFGRCDRENSCGYHQYPTQYLSDKKLVYHQGFQFPSLKGNGNGNPQNIEIDFLPKAVMERSVNSHKSSDLYSFLETLFRSEIATFLCTTYLVGANKHGNTAFFQADRDGNIRQCKIIKYDSITGRRSKTIHPCFVGKKILNRQDANLEQCLFGEHLLSDNENDSKHIALAESEKSCLIATVYFPQFVWIATGGIHGAKWTEPEVCKVFKGRTVILFPDLGCFQLWKEKGVKMAAIAECKVIVSSILEKYATNEDRQEGLDIADFLIRNRDSTGLAITDEGYPVMIDFFPLIAHKIQNLNANGTNFTTQNIPAISSLGSAAGGQEIQQTVSEAEIENRQ